MIMIKARACSSTSSSWTIASEQDAADHQGACTLADEKFENWNLNVKHLKDLVQMPELSTTQESHYNTWDFHTKIFISTRAS